MPCCSQAVAHMNGHIHCPGHCPAPALGNTKGTAAFAVRGSPLSPSHLSPRHEPQGIFYPHGRAVALQQTLDILSYQGNRKHAQDVAMPPAGRKSSKIHSSERQTPKALGKANLLHLSHSITESAVIQHIHCFSLFRQKRANCPGSELDICFTQQRY